MKRLGSHSLEPITMTISPLAGKPAPENILANIPRLVTNYYALEPDPSVPTQRVAFGTSGHRGSSNDRAFNEDTSSPSPRRSASTDKQQGIDGPLFIGIDTHALSEPAFASALEVLAANDVEVMIDDRDGFTPTPVVSHAILGYNRGRKTGPRRRHRHHAVAQSARGRRLQVRSAQRRPRRLGYHQVDPEQSQRADRRRARGRAAHPLRARQVRADHASPQLYRCVHRRPRRASSTSIAIRAHPLKLGVDPLGGAGVFYWAVIAERYGFR